MVIDTFSQRPLNSDSVSRPETRSSLDALEVNAQDAALFNQKRAELASLAAHAESANFKSSIESVSGDTATNIAGYNDANPSDGNHSHKSTKDAQLMDVFHEQLEKSILKDIITKCKIEFDDD